MAEKNYKKYAVIVAGGSGSRMQSSLPKQFIKIGDKVILMHTLLRFMESDASTNLILVLPESHVSTWQELIELHQFDIPHKICIGGNSRFQSVKAGISELPADSIVAIHDGVRPFVSTQTINTCYEIAKEKGNAIAAIALKDSIREVNNGSNFSRNRKFYRLIQTPQTFNTHLIQEAYQSEEKSFFTDDASVFEHAGHNINLVEGSYRNIKITTPEDLLFAGVLLESQA